MRCGAHQGSARSGCCWPATRSTRRAPAVSASRTTRCSSSSTATSGRWHSRCPSTPLRGAGRWCWTRSTPPSPRRTLSMTPAACTAWRSGPWSCCGAGRASAAQRSDEAGAQPRPAAPPHEPMSRRLHTRLAASATAWGVAASYRDAFERRRVTPERVRRRVLEAMGVEPGETPPAGDPVVVVHPGDRLDRPCEVVLEDGTSAGALVRIPTDLPIGYHRLRDDGGERHLLVAPRRCRLPTDRAWGVAVQAYAARSEASWGIGDLDDLRRLAAWTRAIGAGCVAVSPIWAPNPGSHPEASPYFPSTRRFLSPLALAVERVPGASAAGSAFARLARRGRALNRSEEIDRTAVWALKREALWRIWGAGGGAALLDERPCAAFMARSGASLRQWATFAAIGEAHGAGWAPWPGGLG